MVEARTDPLLTTDEAASHLRVGKTYLERQRMNGDGIPFLKLSHRCVRYRLSDLERWLEEQRRLSTSDSGQAA